MFVGSLPLTHLCRVFGTLVALSIPHAASLLAIGFSHCFGHVLGEGRASEGECQSQRERTNARFHGRTPYACMRPKEPQAKRHRFPWRWSLNAHLAPSEQTAQ